MAAWTSSAADSVLAVTNSRHVLISSVMGTENDEVRVGSTKGGWSPSGRGTAATTVEDLEEQAGFLRPDSFRFFLLQGSSCGIATSHRRFGEGRADGGVSPRTRTPLDCPPARSAMSLGGRPRPRP